MTGRYVRLQTRYNGKYNEFAMVWAGANLKNFSKFGIYAATRVYESGIASNRKLECYGESVPKACTHRLSLAKN
jgi:hypothetical protein